MIAVAGLSLCVASAALAGTAGCPVTVDESTFASEAELRNLTARMVGFGLRSTASRSNEKFINWLKREMRQIDGMKIRTRPFALRRWQPLPRADGVPGRDLAKAGGLRVGQQEIPVAGAVPYALPTSERGSQGALVYLPPDQAITAANAAGKVVLREFPDRTIPFIGFQLLGIYVTPDLVARTGNYERPYLAALPEEMIAAGTAGAAGLIFAFDVPREQVLGYFDPHNGTSIRTTARTTGCRPSTSAPTKRRS
jgi:hypothetical protein